MCGKNSLPKAHQVACVRFKLKVRVHIVDRSKLHGDIQSNLSMAQGLLSDAEEMTVTAEGEEPNWSEVKSLVGMGNDFADSALDDIMKLQGE